jgi:hypothetical protein
MSGQHVLLFFSNLLLPSSDTSRRCRCILTMEVARSMKRRCKSITLHGVIFHSYRRLNHESHIITSIIFLDYLFHGRRNVIRSLDTVSSCKDICVCKTNTFQLSIHNMSQEATQVSLEDLELCSLVMLNIKSNAVFHPTIPEHDINM